MEIKIKNFHGRERFQWSGGDANQLFIFIWPYLVEDVGSIINYEGVSGKG